MKAKIIFGIILILGLTVSVIKAQQQMTHTVTAANKYCNATCSLTNISNPFAILIVSPILVNGTSQNPHPIGVFYVQEVKKWSIINLDGVALTEGVKFKVQYYLNPDPNQFVFVVTQAGGTPCLDHAGLNENPNAQVQFSATGSPRGAYFNKHEARIEYDASALKWCIVNLNGQPVSAQTAFNIVISARDTNGNTNPTPPPGNTGNNPGNTNTNPRNDPPNLQNPVLTPVPTPLRAPPGDPKTPKTVVPNSTTTPIPILTPTPTPLPNPTPTILNGFVDMHTHPMSHLGFGKRLLHGAPDVGSLIPRGTRNCNPKDFIATAITEALGNCNSTHGGWNPTNNGCGDTVRSLVISNLFDGKFINKTGLDHQHEGIETTPFNFAYFPHQSSKVHQQMWWEWIKRAKEQGNLRVMVSLTVNSELLATILNGDTPIDDKASADLQIDEIIAFVKRHDDFMEIAKTPADLRRIVGADKLAVILGMEVDNLGNFNKLEINANETTVKAEINRLYAKGVRYIFPIHLVDNKFGGTAVYDNLFNAANKYSTGGAIGNYFDVETGSVEYRLGVSSIPGGDFMVMQTFAPTLTALSGTPYPPAMQGDPSKPDFCPVPVLGCWKTFKTLQGIFTPNPSYAVYSGISGGHVNKKGLTELGKFAVLEMMKLGIIIDIDHMWDKSQADTLAIAERVNNGVSNDYPVNIGHNGLQDPRGSERIALLNTVKRIAALKGVFGIGTSDSEKHKFDSQTFISSFNEVWTAMGGNSYGAVAIGTDVNGMELLPRGPENVLPNFYNSDFPISKTANREWHYPSQGVTHYGLMADFLRDVKQKNPTVHENLMNSAEHFARMWEKAERQKTVVK
jgi:microsomal dipeptidase-like Zn-dependent dipeptidase